MSFQVDITTRGAVFTPAAFAAANRVATAAPASLADEAAERVRSRLRSVLKNPTGRYESSIRTRRDGSVAAVTDSGVIYGPWLEGVSSRNARTRFKGYATFRRVQQSMLRDVDKVAQGDVANLVKELS